MRKLMLSGMMLLSLAGAALSQAPTTKVANTDWLFLGNGPDMQHHADLGQINRTSVSKLGLAWAVDMPTTNGLVGNPLIKDGVIYQGGPFGQIYANDLKTGKQLWVFKAEMPVTGTSFSNYIAYHMNRGIALSGDDVIIAANCDLIAVDQKTGKQHWRSQSCDAKGDDVGITAAPRVGDGLVFTGNACMDAGDGRGFVDAFDIRTGERKWRFYTAPSDPSKPQDSPLYEMAAKTWGEDWYGKTKGCASVWEAITFDQKLHQVYIGTGGPSPWQPSNRGKNAGDELFTNSIVALDASTGAYKWHFKQVPHDAWNYEASNGIMVADLPEKGGPSRVVLNVPKNGFGYVLDAQTGKFLRGANIEPVQWAKGLDANGRPIINPAAEYWKNGTNKGLVQYSHGWEALAYDPAAHTVFIPATVMPMQVSYDPKAVVGGTELDYYYGSRAGLPVYGEVVAWDPVANKVKWRAPKAPLPMNGGLLHLAGGLVFQGMADGRLVAYDSRTGKEVWSHQTGGAIRSAPSSVMIDGVQYIVIATGNGAGAATGYVANYVATPEARTRPRLLAFRLGGDAPYPALATIRPVPEPRVARQDAQQAKIGEKLFAAYGCEVCHGIEAVAPGGRAPSFLYMPPANAAMFRTVVKGGALQATGMPQFADMPDEDLNALFAYIINRAWEAHEHK